MPITCITCGKSMPDASDFCPYCGRAVVRERAGEPRAEPGTAARASATQAAAPPDPAPERREASPVQTSVPRQASPPAASGVPASTRPISPAPPVSAIRPPQPPVRPALARPARLPESKPALEKRVEAISSPGEGNAPAGSRVALHDRLLSAAAYFTFIPAVAFLFLKQYQRSKFIRFHAWQSVFFWILAAALLGLGLLASTFGFLLLWMVTGILVVVGLFLTWLVLSIKALQGEWFRLPGLGQLAEQVGR